MRQVDDLDDSTFPAPEIVVMPAVEDEPTLTLDEGIEMLEYIAGSPHVGHGGFHPNTVATAKWALTYIRRLEAETFQTVWGAVELGGEG